MSADDYWSHSPMITVLVADAQRLFSGALAIALAQRGDLAVLDERPTSLETTVQAAKVWRPDVALVDQWLDGARAVREITQTVPNCKVMLLSWMYGPSHVQEAIEAGAVGFLPKGLDLDRVAEAIARAHSGDPLVYGDELQELVETIGERHDLSDQYSRRFDLLSSRQTQILVLLGKGKLIQEIAKELNILPGTVNVHINGILKKTGARSQAEALAMARVCGVVGGH